MCFCFLQSTNSFFQSAELGYCQLKDDGIGPSQCGGTKTHTSQWCRAKWTNPGGQADRREAVRATECMHLPYILWTLFSITITKKIDNTKMYIFKIAAHQCMLLRKIISLTMYRTLIEDLTTHLDLWNYIINPLSHWCQLGRVTFFIFFYITLGTIILLIKFNAGLF